MLYKLNAGDRMPYFSCLDQDGKKIDSSELLGAPLVLYFYSRDNTSGCTVQACSFRDSLPLLEEIHCRVIGISPDNAASHKSFIEEHDLNFPLLCDENMEICKKFDVIHPKGEKKEIKVERSTFLIDREGIIRWIERPVNVVGHVERVLENLTVYS